MMVVPFEKIVMTRATFLALALILACGLLQLCDGFFLPFQQRLMEDLSKRRPLDLETPKYTVVAQNPAGYEIRRYEPFSVCSVDMNNKPIRGQQPSEVLLLDAVRTDEGRAFGMLADYLFGKNQDQSAMKMTTPVFTDGDKEGGADKQMSFVLPSEFWTDFLSTPKPLNGSGVKIEQKVGGNRAVIMFGGYATKSKVERRKNELLKYLTNDREWQIDGTEPPSLAQYNDPFTPPWKRLNEVSLAVRPCSK